MNGLRVALIAFCMVPAAALAQSKEAQEAQLAAWKTIAGSAGAIDQCTDRYTSEYPAADGSVKLVVTIVQKGTVEQASATTSLDGARNLRPCLESVGKSWKFPPLKAEKDTLTLTVPVKKGQKFVLKKPGEKDAPPQPGQQQQEETVLDFLPSQWGENPQ